MPQRTLATLGPLGSDSENAARILVSLIPGPCGIVLLDSFGAVLRHTVQNGGFALIPAAYQEKDARGQTQESWADTHFRVESNGELELWLAYVLPLKKLALAKQRGFDQARTIALHASTQYYASTYFPEAAPTYHSSKPAAVLSCAQGEADVCIGSLDVVQRYPELEVLRTFAARMCWTIYRRVQSTSMHIRAAVSDADGVLIGET